MNTANQNLNQLALAILSKCNNLNHLKQLQSYLTVIGHSQTQFYSFKLVRFCILNLSNFNYARYIFNHLHSPNIYLFTALVTAYASNPDHHLSAFELYRDMVRRAHPKPNHFIFPHVLKSCQNTKVVHSQIAKLGFSQYPVVQTALVDSYSRFMSDIGCARQVFDEMSERNVVSWTAMITGYTRVGEVGNAISIFDKMPERDVPSWNSIIAGCTQNGLFIEAICLFRKMILVAQSKPNQVTTVCALSACGHTGMLQLGKWIEHYGCLVDILGRAGRFEEALEVVREMKIEPDEVVWGSLLNGCKVHGNTDLAESAIKKLIEIDPKNGGYGIMLANLYGGLGKWDEVRKVRKMLKDHNAYKTPGCSWIEVDNEVCQFYSVDKTHPRSEEIYRILENLRLGVA
ncbi:pentatricopeptide repeat-containing protein, putative [Ricinus communis]|uniref:Pentatricopeptide repeat-containing protein, putative n=1 Tax=Ricinus communis TaxID=3988 RepID=B9SUF9_RICCO|nr:pentatricopeptide repeat-containing protein, putative [Ricinus communis]